MKRKVQIGDIVMVSDFDERVGATFAQYSRRRKFMQGSVGEVMEIYGSPTWPIVVNFGALSGAFNCNELTVVGSIGRRASELFRH